MAEQWQDLKERLENASAALLDMQMAAYVDGPEGRYRHLKSKREGVTLALSYIAEYERDAGALRKDAS